jgi:transcriptional regulator with XRE-family HTH domain
MPPPPSALDQHLARWLRERRGEGTYATLSRTTGVPISTLHRLEMGQQSITLRLLDQILRRLRADPADVFPPDWRRVPKD